MLAASGDFSQNSETETKEIVQQQHTETMKYLALELIREILLRLPVKSLFRFRSVCKSWLSLISDPLFAKSHFELASNLKVRLLYLAANHSFKLSTNYSFELQTTIPISNHAAFQTRSIDVDASLYAPATLNFPFKASFDRINILGSCRGFLLLGDSENLFVWNPLTGSCKKLPYQTSNSLQFSYPFNFGFGYDSLTDDYLVVIASVVESTALHFEFFSLRNNIWRNFERTPFPPFKFRQYRNSGVFLNGAIHWLALQCELYVILALDLAQKNVRKLPLPYDLHIDSRFSIYELFEVGGCLSLSIVGRNITTRRSWNRIWKMEEYGLRSSWTIITMSDEQFLDEDIFVPMILGMCRSAELMKCDSKRELLEYCVYRYSLNGCREAMFTESLLALPSGHFEARTGSATRNLSRE